MTEEDAQRREFFRVQYPLQARPVLEAGGAEYAVIEVSEGGGRAVAQPETPSWLRSGARVNIRFQSGERFTTGATLLRTDGDHWVLKFFPPIPQSTILGEQRWLLARYTREQLLSLREA